MWRMWWNPDSAYSSIKEAGTGPGNKDGSEKMNAQLDFELSRMGAQEMRTEIRRNRLESGLADARRAKDALPEEIGLPSRGMAARAMAVVIALFR